MTKITQGAQESFSDFVARMKEAKASAVLLYHSYVAFASENLELLKNIKTQNLPIDLGKPKVYDVIT